MTLETMPNLNPAVPLRQSHTLELHTLCPVSKNPQAGSTITIRYRPRNLFLEVYSLKAYLRQYRGGRHVDGGFIRDMEQTIQRIAQDCANALAVPIFVHADLLLDSQRLKLIARAYPQARGWSKKGGAT